MNSKRLKIFKVHLKTLTFALICLTLAISCTDSIIESEEIEATQTTSLNLKAATIGNKYYVSKSGSNNNTGSVSAPYLTIQKGLDMATAGDTVFVMTGSYTEYVTFNRSGSAGSPIVLKNYSTNIVTVDGQNARSTCISADNKSYITVHGINVANSTNANLRLAGCQNTMIKDVKSTLAVNASSTAINFKLVPSGTIWGKNIVLQNVNAYGGQYGLYIEERQDGVTISGKFSYAAIDGINMQIPWVHDTALYNRNILVNNVEVDHNSRQGIVTYNLMNSTFRNFHAHHNGATGLQLEDNSTNILVEDFICEDNSQVAKWTYETGLWIDDDENITVRRGILRNNQTGVRVSYSKNVKISNLLIYSNQEGASDGNSAGVDFSSSTVEMYNCTLDGNSYPNANRGGVCLREDGYYVLKNNIFSNDKSQRDIFRTGTHTLVSDNNLIYNTRTLNIYNLNGATTWSNYKSATGQDAHSINANPLYSNTTDYTLQASSPAINTGANIGLTSDYYGKSISGVPDMGACEYGSSSTSATTNSSSSTTTTTTPTTTTPTTAATTTYYNKQMSTTATKNNCGTGYTGSTVTYSVKAGAWSSSISQEDADNKAIADLNSAKQWYANTYGECTPIASTTTATTSTPTATTTTTTYYNKAMSATATKNNCGSGYTGSTVTYSVKAGAWSSTISQLDADNKAIADLNSAKQWYANTYGECTPIVSTATTNTSNTTTPTTGTSAPVKTTYYNVSMSVSATKNSCGSGYTGSTVKYTVPVNKYSSTISQADANNKAQADLNANAQNYANTNGTCTAITTNKSKNYWWWKN